MDEDVLGGLSGLFSVVPKHTDRRFANALQAEHILLHATRHDDREKERFTALSLTRVGYEFGERKTLSAVHLEQKFQWWQLGFWGYTMLHQLIVRRELLVGCRSLRSLT